MRRLVPILAIVVAWGLVLAPPAVAQQGDAEAINAQVNKLYGEGKYTEAIPLAQRVLAIREKALGPDHPHVGTSLNNLALLYQSQGRYGDAEPLYQRALAISEKALGPEHPDVDTSLNNLALLYKTQGRYGDAEPLYKRSLATRERALGPDHPSVGTSLNNLAELYRFQGRYGDAEPLFKRALAISEKALGPDHPDVGTSLNNLALLYKIQGRHGDAEPLYKRTVSIFEKALGPDHPHVGTSLNNLALLYDAQGRYGDAEPLYQHSLSISEKALGPEHPDVGTSLNNLALLYQSQGRYGDAEPLYQRALAISEKALGPEHPNVGLTLNNLALLYQSQGRYGDAEPLCKRSLAISEKALGPEHPNVGQSLNNLALLYQSQGRHSDAEPLYQRSLAIREKALGPEHPDVGQSLNNLATLYEAQGRYSDAEPLYQRSLAIREKALDPEHPDIGQSLNNLALLYQSQRRYSDAEPLYQRALAISEKALGPDHPHGSISLNNLAGLYFAQSDWARAVDHWRRATGVIQRRAGRGLATTSGLTGKGKSEAERNDWYFWGLVKAAHRLATEGPGGAALAAEMYETAQWAQSSEAAASLAQMAARGATGDPKLAAIVRERQDLVSEWQKCDDARSAAVSQPPGMRDKRAEAANVARLAAIDTRIGEIDKLLAKDFPDYAALASPKPISIDDVQAQLRDDEALVLFLDTPAAEPTPEETFIWVVTKGDSHWVRSELGTKALGERVVALRCGLDRDGEWRWSKDTGRWMARKPACASLRPQGLTSTEPLPFDVAKVHELYKGLLAEVEDLIKGKHLLLVPSGALTSLPFQVLVTADPAGDDLAAAAWLIRDHALTVLPSVASLAALRRNAKLSAAPEPFIGFGDPVLMRSCGSVFIPDKCPEEEIKVASAEGGVARSAGSLEAVGNYFRGGLADVAALKSRLCPLPDTAHELSCVAKSVGAGPASLVLAKGMTETAAKAMALDRYRVVHFATHGLLAGETAQLAKNHAEPALVFSPPDTATEKDDGLLTASEVAGLKLDADWVVMSACNTAGGAEPGAEALSGLAKAFFYAGARALLVSHWPVNSYAATVLTSRTFAEMKKKPTIGRSEAFRRAMLALISDKDRPWAAHPSAWAPFVVVGEGGAAQ